MGTAPCDMTVTKVTCHSYKLLLNDTKKSMDFSSLSVSSVSVISTNLRFIFRFTFRFVNHPFDSAPPESHGIPKKLREDPVIFHVTSPIDLDVTRDLPF